jgi:hypothetical protein
METALSACEDKVLRLVAERGARGLERRTVLPAGQHEGEPPAGVQFLEMPSEAILDAHMNGPVSRHGSPAGRSHLPHGPLPHPAGFIA